RYLSLYRMLIFVYLQLFIYFQYVLFRTFLFNSIVDHVPLHSFPTRRSSDLSTWAALVLFLAPRDAKKAEAELEAAKTKLPAEKRSEEHTSELQSPDHLVCRLLLEKKNTKA